MRWPERKHIALWVKCTQIYERRQNIGTGIDNPAMVMVKQTASFHLANSVRDAGAGGSNPLTPTRISAKFPARSTVSPWYRRTGAGLALILAALLPAPALAGSPDIADVVAVHAELRALDGIPAYDWVLDDGVWDCDDWGRWARAALEAHGWPREALVIWAGRDAVFGDVHAVLCASGATTEPVCLDRRQNALVPLSSYGPGWRAYPWQ